MSLGRAAILPRGDGIVRPVALLLRLLVASLIGLSAAAASPSFNQVAPTENSAVPDDRFEKARARATASNGFLNQHDQWQNDFVRRSWEWHLTSTKIIFFIVLLVVSFGLVVSWMQFRIDVRAPAKEADPKADEQPAYDFSASAQQVSIKSKTIGALILVFSGVFFFLYLSIVYPMSVVDNASRLDDSTANSQR
jgi:hypothetical protein